MRSRVYRNLDNSFEILGFNIFELVMLTCTLVLGGELAQFFDIQRIWSFLFTFLLGLSFYWLRKSLGNKFIPRLIRFVYLPKSTPRKLMSSKWSSK